MNRPGKLLELSGIKSSRRRHHVWSELGDKVSKSLKAGGVLVDIVPVNPALCNKPVGQAVQQNQIRLRPDSVMLGRPHGCFSLARIDDNDFRPMFVPTDALPHDRM